MYYYFDNDLNLIQHTHNIDTMPIGMGMGMGIPMNVEMGLGMNSNSNLNSNGNGDVNWNTNTNTNTSITTSTSAELITSLSCSSYIVEVGSDEIRDDEIEAQPELFAASFSSSSSSSSSSLPLSPNHNHSSFTFNSKSDLPTSFVVTPTQTHTHTHSTKVTSSTSTSAAPTAAVSTSSSTNNQNGSPFLSWFHSGSAVSDSSSPSFAQINSNSTSPCLYFPCPTSCSVLDQPEEIQLEYRKTHPFMDTKTSTTTTTKSTTNAKPQPFLNPQIFSIPNKNKPRRKLQQTSSSSIKTERGKMDFEEAFNTGTIIPYLVDASCGSPEDVDTTPGRTPPDSFYWNGLQPLEPMPCTSALHTQNNDTRNITHAITRHQQRERKRQHYNTTFNHDHLRTQHLENIQLMLYSTPTSPPSSLSVSTFPYAQDQYLNEEAIAPNSPPRASSSKSIPPSQQAKVQAASAPTTHQGPTGGKVMVQQAGADRSALKELPALRDAPPGKREELFILKLKLCSVIFTFDDPTLDKRGKDMKRQTLLELVDYVNTPAGQKIFTESVMSDLMYMVRANVCRALPPATDDFDPEEDEPVLEPAWPHLQVAYEFFLRFIVSSEVNAKAAKKYVDQKFCLQLVELFDSEDPRERDYLKTILHRIYGKFMSHRSFIRRAISNVFYRFVYETERHNGIGELLEILGSIINGFAIPLKKEHLQFLVRALIPLHKPKCVALYHQQLSYCIIQYVEKDADTATPILNGFFKCWPWSNSGKQVMFLNELEEILELLGADQLAQVSDMLFTNLARCLDSEHFQVVERALFLWNNEHLVNSGCLSRLNAQAVLPIIYGPLYKNSSGHWNATVEGLAQNVLKMYMEYDLVLYDKCTSAHFRDEEEAKNKLKAIEQKWSAIEKMATTNTPGITVK